jgi:uncharacterized protein (DUF1778 family)
VTGKKRGRPIDPNAKRNGINLRLSREEAQTLGKMSKESGRSRTDILLDVVRKELGRGE